MPWEETCFRSTGALKRRCIEVTFSEEIPHRKDMEKSSWLRIKIPVEPIEKGKK
jgi:hypothetical protein